MKEQYGIRLNRSTIPRLKEIAASVGALAPSGPIKGQPSISTMLERIANGDLEVRRRGD